MRQTFGIFAALVALLLIAALLFSEARNGPVRTAAAAGNRALEARIGKIRGERAYAEVRVSRRTPRLMRRPNEPIEESFDAYRDAQFRMIKSVFVLTPALRDQSIGDLQIISEQPNALKFLEQRIEVDVDEEFLIVSFDGPRSDETAKIVNAVVHSYFEEVVYVEGKVNRERLNSLQQTYVRLESEIRAKWTELKQLEERLGSQLVSNEDKVIGRHRKHILEELARAKFELTRNRARLSSAKANAAPAATDERDLDFEIERRLDEDAIAAALVARRSIVRLLLADGDKEDASRQRPPELERELAVIDKALAERQTELREKAAKQFKRESRQDELQLEISEGEAWIKQLQSELSQIQRNGADAGAGIETLTLRDDVKRMQKIAGEIADEIEWLKIELNAPPRVTLLSQANAR